MPSAGDGFERNYNAQGVVETESLPVVALDDTQSPDDKRVESMPRRIDALPAYSAKVETLLEGADRSIYRDESSNSGQSPSEDPPRLWPRRRSRPAYTVGSAHAGL